MPDQSPNEPLDSEYDFGSVVRTPFYFGPENKRLLGWLHTTSHPHQHDVGVVICPSLAVEYLSSYRSMRYVADYFALAGIPSFRFDYHGTGDSSGSNDDGNRLDDWLWSLEQANSEIKRLTGCSKTGLLGLRMGATFAALASENTAFDFLVLWAALESGRKYIREIRAIQMTGISQDAEEKPDMLEGGGLVYWPETADAIGSIDLMKITPQTPRILIVPRDDLRVNTKLIDTWSGRGLHVEQADHQGSADMLVDVQDAIVPHDSIKKIVHWVSEGSDGNIKEEDSAAHPAPASSALVSSMVCGDVKESIVRFGINNNFAILSEPVVLDNDVDLPIVVIANSGANHRVGPGRLYVVLARELARLGFSCLRIDIPGLGDSVINNVGRENRDYIEDSSEVIREAMEVFGVKPQGHRYIVTGLCSGAYASFHAALDLDKVDIVESILINPLTFYWHEGMELEETPAKNFGYWNWYKKAAKDPESWKKLMQGRSNYRELINTIKNRVKVVFSGKTRSLRVSHYWANGKTPELAEDELNSDLMKLASNNTQLSFVLAKSDPGYDILMTSAGKTAHTLLDSGKMKIYMIENTDHTFSKYKSRCHVINTIASHMVARYLKDNKCH